MNKHPFFLTLAFTAASLAGVHLGTFVWLTAFVYHHSIRDYVPAGITGVTLLFLAWVILQVPLVIAGRRRHQTMPYVLGGLLGVPVAVVVSSLYSSALSALLGYSLQIDVAVASSGAVLFMAMAIVIHRCCLSKKSDDKPPCAIAPTP